MEQRFLIFANNQILLLGVGALLVITSTLVGLNYFSLEAVKSNRDAVILDLQSIAAKSQAYYKKPNSLAGGEESFLAFEIPEELKTTQNGKFKIIYAQSDRMLVEGIGKEKVRTFFSCSEQAHFVTVQILIKSSDVSLKTIH